MQDVRLDHATIDTRDVQASADFYRHFLDLKPGWRPSLDTDGAWLYPAGGDYAIVHLIATEGGTAGGRLNHIAFRGTDLQAYIEKLESFGGWFEAMPVPETPFTQVHHMDPSGVKIEVIFQEQLGDVRLAHV